jgi:hypothetical protein
LGNKGKTARKKVRGQRESGRESKGRYVENDIYKGENGNGLLTP